jgi:hypothetical protein
LWRRVHKDHYRKWAPCNSVAGQEGVDDLDVSDRLAIVEVLGEEVVAAGRGGCLDD